MEPRYEVEVPGLTDLGVQTLLGVPNVFWGRSGVLYAEELVQALNEMFLEPDGPRARVVAA